MAQGLPGQIPAFSLAPEVRLVPAPLLDLPEYRAALRTQVLALNPDVCMVMFSWQDMLWWPVLLQGTGIPLLISERNNPEIIEKERWNRADRLTAMCGADIIHLLCRSYAASLPDWLQERVRVIPNGSAMPGMLKDDTDSPEKILLAAGRLDDKTKRFSQVIRAFASISKEFPDWRLEIRGDGPDRAALQNLVHELGLDAQARLCGMTPDMAGVYGRADIFCHASRFEGFPNAVIEAMRHSLPVVGYASCSGLNEIVRHGESGILVELEAELAPALQTLMRHKDVRLRMARAAYAAGERYGLESVLDQWEAVLGRPRTAKAAPSCCCPWIRSLWSCSGGGWTHFCACRAFRERTPAVRVFP